MQQAMQYNKRYYTTGANMAGKAKSIYLTVLPKGSHVSVFKKMFFEAKSYNDYVKSVEFKETYPATEFDIVKETY